MTLSNASLPRISHLYAAFGLKFETGLNLLMNLANFSYDWPVSSKHHARRLFRKLRRQAGALGLGRLLRRFRSQPRSSVAGTASAIIRLIARLAAQLADQLASQIASWMARSRISRIEIGQAAQIDRTAQITAPLGTVVRLKQAVRLGQHTRLDACQEGRIALEDSVSLGHGAAIVAQAGSVEIGSSTSIGALCHLFSAAKIKIGRNCQLGNRVTLYAQSGHQSTTRLAEPAAGRIVIEDHCWIGNNVLILAGVTIGQHSVIGDDAVIVNDVPAFSVAAGQPAKSFNGGLREVLQDDAPTDAGYAVRIALKLNRNRLSES
jgi:acetyltransferase-like isoleucine patch superfamily enzyme